MGIFDTWRRRRWTVYSPGSFGIQVANLSTAELYGTQPNLRAVVSFLADNAAQVPLKVYDRVSEDDRKRVRDSAAALLLEHPNPDMTPFELKRAIYSDLGLYGRSLALTLPDKETPSGWQLRHIPATWLIGYKGSWPFSPEAVIVHNGDGAAIEFPAERFLLFHGYSPTDPMQAYEPVRALQETLFEQVESYRFRRRMWQRGGRFNAYIKRPKDVEKWSDEAFERFKETWDNSWGGDKGADAGKMPILEDGMEIAQVQFNSRDAQWSEAAKLSREDVAGVYHINPALIWPGSGQTYASAKDNARALYNDALAPILMEVTERINKFLLPRIGESAEHYVEYDISIKTEGTFEEKLGAIQAAAGAPILTRNEARAKLNLPALDGGDELITPLNVLAGGQLSAPIEQPQFYTFTGNTVGKKTPARYKADPEDEQSLEMTEALREFFRRQRNSVLPRIGAEKKKGRIKASDWWDEERWDRELSDTLHPIALNQCTANAKKTLLELDIEDTYSEERTDAYIRSMTDRRAAWINRKTKDELDGVEDWDGSEDADRATYAGVFDYAESDRAETAGTAFAVAVAGFAAMEALQQCAPDRAAKKTWTVNSGNPRFTHAMMDGETVELSDTFSNGALWPGDTDALGPDEVANCQCTIEITV